MEIIAKRIRALREGLGISQKELGKILGIPQQSINRYENNYTNIPLEIVLKYADYFDISIDYLFGRCDKPQGKNYEFKPKVSPESKEIRVFIDQCFDPNSPMSDRLKELLYELMEEHKNESN